MDGKAANQEASDDDTTGSQTMTIVVPIVPSGLDRMQSAGSDAEEKDEEVQDTVSSPVSRRNATLFDRCGTPGNPGVPRTIAIDPYWLEVASRRDTALAERPSVSFARRRVHRARKKALFDARKMERC